MHIRMERVSSRPQEWLEQRQTGQEERMEIGKLSHFRGGKCKLSIHRSNVAVSYTLNTHFPHEPAADSYVFAQQQ